MKKILLALCLLLGIAQATPKLTFYFDAGGPVGGAYDSIVVNGARMAAKNLDINLKIYYSNWQASKMINNFKKALASSPAGIAIMGHPGDDAFSLLLKKAEKRGIIITSLDTPLPRAEQKYAPKGFGYVGTSYYKSGQALVKEAIKRNKTKKGSLALVWGLLSQPTRGMRARGMLDELKKEGMKTIYIEISNEINKDPSLGSPVFTAYITKYPQTKLIFIDHGGLTAQMENFSKIAGISAKAYYICGGSLSSATIHAIKNGYVDLVSDGQPFLQGYLAVTGLVLSKKYGFSGLHIDTGAGFISKDNIKQIESLAKQNIR